MSKYQSKRLWLIGTVIIGTAINTSALGDDPPKADDTAEAMSHYIVQSIPPGVPVSGKPAPIKLTDEQRAKIRSVLATKNTEVSHKKAAAFEPQIGATIPSSLKPQAFPRELTAQIPAAQPYTYLEFKGQVLIVDPMSRKIVDQFPEASG